MPETGTVLTDGVWFALGSTLAVLASGVAAWVTLRVESRRGKDAQQRWVDECALRAEERDAERKRWAEERKDRAQERDARERERHEEAGRRWDRERHVAYADYLQDAESIGLVLVRTIAKRKQPTNEIDLQLQRHTQIAGRARLLMSAPAREAADGLEAAFVNGYVMALTRAGDPELDQGFSDWLKAMKHVREVARSRLRVELGLEDEPMDLQPLAPLVLSDDDPQHAESLGLKAERADVARTPETPSQP